MPDSRVKALGFKLYYQNDQYLGSFLRRANTFAFESSGHDSYGVPELEMFLGLKDVNGKEIYEGDIVAFHWGAIPSKAVVEWDEEVGGFRVKIFDGRSVNMTVVEEVIGNVHENPELLNPSPPEAGEANRI